MKVLAGAVWTVMAGLGVIVIVGMVLALDRTADFGVGTISVRVMVLQEVCGVLALAALALVFHQMRLLWRGHGAGARAVLAVLVALALFVVFIAVYVGAHSS